MTDKNNTKFLVIDETPTSRRLVKTFLKKMGYTDVVEAENGAEALEKLHSEEVEFIISDFHMEDISCTELFRQIRSEENLKHIPFVMLTSPRDVEKLTEVKEAGIEDCVAKPLDLGVLSSKVEEVLARDR
jgi:two-component system, chemotaxis family, chemotaxis protein CheY